MSQKHVHPLWSVLASVLLIFAVGSAATSGATGKFEKTFSAIKAAQTRQECSVKLAVVKDAFVAYTLTKTKLSEKEFQKLLEQKKLLKKTAKGGDPGDPVMYRFADGTAVAVYTLDTGNTWLQINMSIVGQYRKKDFSEFLKAAVSHGLTSYKVTDPNNGVLTFRRDGPEKLDTAIGNINLPKGFYQHMRLVEKYKPRKGKNGFVLLVHEPHWCSLGQHQLVLGLRALIRANRKQGKKAKFLIEGWFEKGMRDIKVAPVSDLLDSSVPAETQVLFLLRNHLIDGPMAYRLLYSDSVAATATAIDDPKLIEKTPASTLSSVETLVKTLLKLRKQLGPNSKIKPSAVFLGARKGLPEELKGEHLVAFQKNMGKELDRLAAKLASMPNPELRDPRRWLLKEADAYRNEAVRLEIALQRDVVMAKNINTEMAGEPQVVHIAFIGNFHTPGIIALLAKDCGYAVIESRLTLGASTEQDRKKFQGAINPKARAGYIRSLMLKSRVAPQRSEYAAYRKVLSSAAKKTKGIWIATQKQSPFDIEVTKRIAKSIQTNGMLTGARLAFANKEKVPTKYRGAFASISPGLKNGSPTVTCIDSRKAKWCEAARLDFLTSLSLQLEKAQQQKQIYVQFHLDPKTKVIFACVYDLKLNMFFLYEGDAVKSIMESLPTSSIFHMRTVRVYPAGNDRENFRHIPKGRVA